MKRSHLALLFAFTMTAGCVSVDQKMLADIKQQVAQSQQRTLEAGGGSARLPWKEGQWAKMAYRDGEVWYLQTVSIVGREGDGYWIETKTVDPRSDDNPSRMKMLVSGYDPARPESVKSLQISHVITQSGNNQGLEAPPFLGPLTANWVLAPLKMDVHAGSAEDVTVPAGTFKGASRQRVKVQVGPIESEADHWVHPKVPVWGLVKTLATDGSLEMQLLDFGLSGAQTEIKDVMRGPFGSSSVR